MAPIPDTQPKADGGDALNVRERTVVEAAAEPTKVETQVVEAEADGVEGSSGPVGRSIDRGRSGPRHDFSQ